MKEYSSTILLQTTDKEEITNIIFSFNSNKASGPNSILYRILFLLKQRQFYSASFMTGVFPSVIKTAKVYSSCF